MSYDAFILAVFAVCALWVIAVAAEDAADELARIREQIEDDNL